MSNFRNFIPTYFQRLAVFTGPGDIRAFRRLRANAVPGNEPVAVRIRPLGNEEVWCRPGTKDAVVLWATFHGRHHLPPARLRPECAILDLGANVGYTPRHFARLYPQARIVAVEMDGGNCLMASRNLERVGERCVLVNAAVWSSDGEVRYAGPNEESYRVLDRGEAGGSAVRSVPSRTVQTILDGNGMDIVDYLKMDVEGAESEILRGNIEWTRRVMSMKIEIHRPEELDPLSRVLSEAGYLCRRDESHACCLYAARRGWLPD